ncbi:molybdopterin converting factor subunit 1 [Synechococcus sp. PCC 6312]|uniref:molybdopterin converting factor subunit 1 n=1 Tax=Synechococcus sp. (strain ATCC 27167 / PCC 6312) TaxID=195253 RepID=UPI00029F48A9|nr:molybdopterin converting factor subunit 1 [Synechococcus sp. PCC 6312]AFY60302.1 molybdopterin converting factor, subunit 1 [Synechococcus sp. PCC 6312]
MNTINVRYFAALQEQAQLSEEIITTDLKTYGELYQWLASRYRFSLPLSQVQVAVNDHFLQLTDQITDQAQVVFIPPVAGG